MTIAGVYLSPEGIVLGADSTSSSVAIDNGMHFFDFNQKVFEIGENGTLGVLTWGLGSLGPTSYRTLLALLADDLKSTPPASFIDVAQRWIDQFWLAYTTCDFFRRYTELKGLSRPRTPEEDKEFLNLSAALVVGFCIGGYVLPNRNVQAAYMVFDPNGLKPAPMMMIPESEQWWGVPNIINRLMMGADDNLFNALLTSGLWNGTPQDLLNVIQAQRLVHVSLPVRDAVDYVHSCIQCTIKALKFSNMSQICGGPIEIAVITSDRNFRWVRHKSWDAAITDGGI